MSFFLNTKTKFTLKNQDHPLIYKLGHPFRHCPKLDTAASKKSLGSSQSQCGESSYSDSLKICGLSSFYPTNYL